MPTGYQIKEQNALHYITLQVVYWIDIFTRKTYRDIVIESLRYCQKEKGLEVYAYVIMSNHVHFVLKSENNKYGKQIKRLFQPASSRKLKNQLQ